MTMSFISSLCSGVIFEGTGCFHSCTLVAIIFGYAFVQERRALVCWLAFLSYESFSAFTTISFLTFPNHPHLFTGLQDIDNLRKYATT